MKKPRKKNPESCPRVTSQVQPLTDVDCELDLAIEESLIKDSISESDSSIYRISQRLSINLSAFKSEIEIDGVRKEK